MIFFWFFPCLRRNSPYMVFVFDILRLVTLFHTLYQPIFFQTCYANQFVTRSVKFNILTGVLFDHKVVSSVWTQSFWCIGFQLGTSKWQSQTTNRARLVQISTWEQACPIDPCFFVKCKACTYHAYKQLWYKEIPHDGQCENWHNDREWSNNVHFRDDGDVDETDCYL